LDENSSVQIEDGLKIAVENRIPVHCVGVGRIQEAVLRRIAKLTSGEYAPITSAPSDLIAQRISELPEPSPAPRPSSLQPVAALPAPSAAPAPTTPGCTAVGTLWSRRLSGAAYLLRNRARPTMRPRRRTQLVRDPDESADSTVVMRAPRSRPGRAHRDASAAAQPDGDARANEGEVFN
jgi:hypothetical protein